MPTATKPKSILTSEEKETIITFDETPADAVIFTYNKTWQQHLEKGLGLKATMNNGHGGREYHIPKKRIPLPRAPKKLSAEQRRKLGVRLKEARRQKSPNSRQNNAVTMKSGGKSFGASNSSNRTKSNPKNQQKSAVQKIEG